MNYLPSPEKKKKEAGIEANPNHESAFDERIIVRPVQTIGIEIESESNDRLGPSRKRLLLSLTTDPP